jgi:hypothetical protein
MKKLDSQVFVSEFFAQVWLMFLNDDQTRMRNAYDFGNLSRTRRTLIGYCSQSGLKMSAVSRPGEKIGPPMFG